MSDILDRAEDLAERYNSSGFIHRDATLMLPELIAEIKQQAAYVARLEAAYQEAEAACRYYEGGLMDCEADDKAAFFGWPGRDYQAMSDQSILDLYRKEAREALERIKRGEQE